MKLLLIIRNEGFSIFQRESAAASSNNSGTDLEEHSPKSAKKSNSSQLPFQVIRATMAELAMQSNLKLRAPGSEFRREWEIWWKERVGLRRSTLRTELRTEYKED